MADSPSQPPWMFNLNGTFLGFCGDDPAKAKVIRLAVEGEVLAIKLPKALREPLQLRLQPGDYLRCIGRSSWEDGQIKLKAYQVFNLLPPLPKTCTYPQEAIAQAWSGQPSTRPGAHQPVKIQVCRKSGCQKRGGRDLVMALEQALRDRNLHSQVEIQYTGCQKHCSEAPTLTVLPGPYRYSRVKLSRLSVILDRHLTPTKPNP
ncbi:MAG TPA: (2Fe-2S) ferredoxin domain-containing protein [Leptolyngbyaceae cyanobacterium M65_K2018_010]|nr:(2Fe-2S) ferredoxin domain-containing protein [Leptolyngbyaceae cyanobacterium M65_K2018_010]